MYTRSAQLARPAAAVGRGYWTVWTATVIFFAGFYALLTPLPRYMVGLGLSDWQIGLVLGTFGIASLLGRPVAGLATDRWGARPVMLAGVMALFVGALGVVAATTTALLFALRLLQAAGYVAFTTAGTALVVALTPPAARGRRLAVFGTAANIAITLTPAAVSALLVVAPVQAGFLAAGALALVAGALAWRSPGGLPASGAGMRLGWSFPRPLVLPMLAAALFGTGFAAFFQYAPILAARRAGLDAGWLYTAYGIGLITARLGAGGLTDRLGVARVLAGSALLMATGLLILAWATAPAAVFPAVLLLAIAGLFHPALIAHHVALLPAAPGKASAAFYVGFDLGIGLGTWLLGAVLDATGLTGLYLTAALLVLATLVLVPPIARQHRKL